MPNVNSTWGLNVKTAICEECDWRYALPAQLQPPLCPHCFQARLTPLEDHSQDVAGNHSPELIIPFSVSPEQLSRNIQQFAGGIWFAPADLTPENLQSRLQPIYLPMWLVDSQAQATWQAEAGFNYEAVSHRDSFDDRRGGWYSQQITETRIRWEPCVGRLTREYHNIAAPALEEHFELARQLGQFNLEAGRPYQSHTLEQALVRLPNRSPSDAWPDVAPAYQAAAAEECRRAAAADHIREFRWAAQFHNQNWTLLLFPIYTTYYLDDDNRPQPVLIHGQTAQLSGPKRASMRRAQRVALMIVIAAAVIFTLSLIVAGVSFFVPPLFLVAGVGIALAIIVGMMAVAPPVIVWQINRTTQ